MSVNKQGKNDVEELMDSVIDGVHPDTGLAFGEATVSVSDGCSYRTVIPSNIRKYLQLDSDSDIIYYHYQGCIYVVPSRHEHGGFPKMGEVSVTCQGSVTIPSNVVDYIGFEDGDKVIMVCDGDMATINRATDNDDDS